MIGLPSEDPRRACQNPSGGPGASGRLNTSRPGM